MLCIWILVFFINDIHLVSASKKKIHAYLLFKYYYFFILQLSHRREPFLILFSVGQYFCIEYKSNDAFIFLETNIHKGEKIKLVLTMPCVK